MAEIKNYDDEINKRKYGRSEQEKEERAYQWHRTWKWLRFVLLAVVLIGGAAFVYLRYRGKIYTGYEVTHSIARTKVDGATDVKLGSSVLTYSQDGAHCIDIKGTMTGTRALRSRI